MMQITIDKLIAMKLSGMVEGLEEQMNSSVYNDLSFDERFSMLVDKEMASRENRRLSMLMRRARFRHPNACVEEVDFRAKRGIRKETVLKLAQNEWMCNPITSNSKSAFNRTANFLADLLQVDFIKVFDLCQV